MAKIAREAYENFIVVSDLVSEYNTEWVNTLLSEWILYWGSEYFTEWVNTLLTEWILTDWVNTLLTEWILTDWVNTLLTAVSNWVS